MLVMTPMLFLPILVDVLAKQTMLLIVLGFVYHAILIVRLAIRIFCACHAEIPTLILTEVLDVCAILDIIWIALEHAKNVIKTVIRVLVQVFVQLAKIQTHIFQTP